MMDEIIYYGIGRKSSALSGVCAARIPRCLPISPHPITIFHQLHYTYSRHSYKIFFFSAKKMSKAGSASKGQAFSEPSLHTAGRDCAQIHTEYRESGISFLSAPDIMNGKIIRNTGFPDLFRIRALVFSLLAVIPSRASLQLNQEFRILYRSNIRIDNRDSQFFLQ